MNLQTLRTLVRYSDHANNLVLRSAVGLSNDQLDRLFDMGVGSLRKTLIHIVDGESVWLQRCQGNPEAKWPPQDEPRNVSAITEGLQKTYRERDAFLATVREDDMARAMVYRDSRGGLFETTLGDMLLQLCIHSMHHRAQAVNMLRRVEGSPPEVDYMVWMRRPKE
jgi:uncharacterized damage-inducible protein DinB